MGKFIKPPVLSTSFSVNGKSVKKRFENILNKKSKIGVFAFVAILLTMASMSLLVAFQDANGFSNIIQKHYLKLYKNDQFQWLMDVTSENGKYAYILTCGNMSEDGEKGLDVFAMDRNLKTNYVATSGFMAQSPCYSVNSAELDGKTIIWGNYNDQKYDLDQDKMVEVELIGIELSFKDGTQVKHEFNVPKYYIVEVVTTAELEEANVYGKDGNVVSTLRDTMHSRNNFIEVND